MKTNINTINLGGLAGNCYLIETNKGFILIDTGGKTKRKKLEKELENLGCVPGKLKLIILTHGDFDHSGNGAYLRDTFDTKIAMHIKDRGIVKNGDMFYNQEKKNKFLRSIINFLFRIKKFEPDFTVDEGYSLSEYGVNARIIYLPGYSKGSIGIITEDGSLFCGDLITNSNRHKLKSIKQNKDIDAIISRKKLRKLLIGRVYPGHGKPFNIDTISI